ncbi:MAG TPA: type II toxin-antitoxin system HicB family antitoxin [Planctomycetota bacterium]|nr:type II toxin-antitoxin system HicB family antitoxin [Planctomycetota bacterium]
MRRFLIITEKGEHNYSAYSPDVPGCVSTGETIEETEAQMVEAIRFHLEGLAKDGVELPKPSSSAASFVVLA